jgi:hypothetical protein
MKKVFFLVLLAGIVCTSCEKEVDLRDEYVGEWAADALANESVGFVARLALAPTGCAVAMLGDDCSALDTTCVLTVFCESRDADLCSGVVGFCESSSKSSQLRIDIFNLTIILIYLHCSFKK